MKKISITVVAPVTFSIEVTEEELEKIRSGDYPTIYEIRERAKNKMDYFIHGAASIDYVIRSSDEENLVE